MLKLKEANSFDLAKENIVKILEIEKQIDSDVIRLSEKRLP